MKELTETLLLLLQRLADGKFHSGQELADEIGCSRSAVWNQIKHLRDLPGLTIHAVTGRGYQLQPALTLLNKQKILACLNQKQAIALESCHMLTIVDSTNTQALANPPQNAGGVRAWFAEYQTAGRGRRGRSWQSGFAQNLQCSIAYQFDLPMQALAGLSIAVGVGLADRLTAYGLQDLGLKWPNDLLWQDKKMAGILLEVQGESAGPSLAVMGVGLNLHMDKTMDDLIDQPYTSLAQTAITVDRNQLAGEVLATLLEVCQHYQTSGLTSFIDRWRDYDRYQGQAVTLTTPQQQWHGRYAGIADDGGLVLQGEEGKRTFYAGEVSLRALEKK